MMKSLVSAALILTATLAQAEPVAMLTKPAQTLDVAGEAADMSVQFAPRHAGLEVSMNFLDREGERFESRVILADRQSHEIVFTDEERGKRSRFRVERAGLFVGVHLIEGDLDGRLAVYTD